MENNNLRLALEWWYDLPIQNLEDVNDSKAGYCIKYFPNRNEYCGTLGQEEILYIWKQENF